MNTALSVFPEIVETLSKGFYIYQKVHLIWKQTPLGPPLSKSQEEVFLRLLQNQVDLNFWRKSLLSDSSTLNRPSLVKFIVDQQVLIPPSVLLVGQYDYVYISKKGRLLIIFLYIVIGGIVIFLGFLLYRYYFSRFLRFLKKLFFLFFQLRKYFFHFFDQVEPIVEKVIETQTPVEVSDSNPIIPSIVPGLKVLRKIIYCQQQIQKYFVLSKKLLKQINSFKKRFKTITTESELKEIQKLSKKLLENAHLFQNSSGSIARCVEKFPVLLKTQEYLDIYEASQEINSFFHDYSQF